MKRSIVGVLLLILTLVIAGAASSTELWEQRSADDFERGTVSNVTISSDGRLQLAPEFTTLYQPGDPFVWSLASDSRGRVFLGTGNEGKVYVVADGKGTEFFKASEVEVHALAVDQQNNLYAGTSPDGKIYKVTPDGKSETFFEPKAKYIWALAVDQQGNVYAATGEKGAIYRIAPDGKGSVIFTSNERHLRCIAFDSRGNLIAGSDGSGRIYRVSPDGHAFVLHDSKLREITSIAIAADDTIYASAIGGSGPAPAGGTVSPFVRDLQSIAASLPPGVQIPPQALPASTSTPNQQTARNSEVIRIGPDGYPRSIWKTDRAMVLALALDRDGNVLAGSGDDGIVYRISPDGRSSALLNRAAASQVTVLATTTDGKLYAACSNLGKLVSIAPTAAREGSIQSQVKDARVFSEWGHVSWRAEVPQGTSVEIRTRSGNTAEPDNTWSPWSAALTDASGSVVSSPRARFIQWKAVLKSTAAATPALGSVLLAYLPHNVAPEFKSLALQPRGIALEPLPQPAEGFGSTTTVASLNNSNPAFTPFAASSNPQFSRTVRRVSKKGYRALSFDVSDENSDTLRYSIFIRGEGEREWRLLKDRSEDAFFSFDTTNFADGQYVIKVVATDAPSNTFETTLETSRETEPFDIDNTPPSIEVLSSKHDGKRLRVSFRASDSATAIESAQYSVDGGEMRAVLPADHILDSRTESFDFALDDLSPGEHVISIRVSDRAGNVAAAKLVVQIK